MESPKVDIPAVRVSVPPAEGTPVWLRFALLGTLFLLAALRLEPFLGPLCRATAVQAAALLSLAGLAPLVQGDLVALSGFTAQIVPECTPLYACLLYGALVLAQPASPGRTLAGLLTGVLVIASANLLRISLVTAAGPGVSGFVFDLLHVYLSQVAMLLVVVGAALYWLRWSAKGGAPFPFLLRAGLPASALFVPWVAVNRSYLALLDHLVALLFSLLYPGFLLLTPRPFALYNHTFAVPLFLALVLSGRGAWSGRRLAAVAGGVCLIACWHALFRISHVVWTALGVAEIVPLHQAIYLLGQFLLPFLFWIRMHGCALGQGRGLRLGPLIPMLLLLLSLGWSSPAQAESVLTAHYDGRGGFSIKADNLNRVTEAEIRIDYLSDDQTIPQVTSAGLGARGTLEVQAASPGSFTLRLKSNQPMSGSVMLATAQIQGTVSFITGWLRNEKGATETPTVVISNPTDEQLSALPSRRPVPKPKVAGSPAGSPSVQPAATVVAASPGATVLSANAVRTPVLARSERATTYIRRRSVLELVREHSGERNPVVLARFFERADDIFLQEPPVLLSDGVAALRLAVRLGDRSEKAPRFFISGGSCKGLKVGDYGAWLLEIVPEQGSLATSVTVLSNGEMVEFPLAVAPPLELFDQAGAEAGDLEYVETANWLVSGKQAVK
jgi:exosortase/archaeosortase family protein